MDCPADIVTGTATLLKLKGPPVTAICVICTSFVPEFITATACVTLPLTSTFPKLSALVLNESCADPAAAPLSFTFDDDPPCEVIAVSVPEADPEVELVNTT
jgi:hypothetical protein